MSFDPERLTGLIELLTRFFYALMAVALLSVLLGAPGSALFFLVVGALAQVLRAAIQERAWQRQAGARLTFVAPGGTKVNRTRAAPSAHHSSSSYSYSSHSSSWRHQP